ncbi:MAG: hypothetical protein IPK82_06875 [Polyangiaceae bacterium]|nr:hypothetical protein [Polyangiaceae bacterium]
MYLRFLQAAAFVLVFLTSFRVFAGAPTATTSPATSITTSSAVLNGAGNPNGEQATGWFRISATNPVTCDDTFGTRVPASGGTDLGSGAASVPYSITATGLTSGVTYYFCAIVQNASGTAFGGVLSFFVPGAPSVTTGGVTSLTSTSATLNGSTNPNGAATTAWFRYATTNPGTCNDTFGTRAPTSGGTSLGSGTSFVDHTRAIASLTPGATYYYCAISSNSLGTSFGAVQSFTALPDPPSVSTSSATLVTGTTAQLNGSANPGGASTTGWFRYSTTNPGTCNDTFGTRAPASGGSSLGAGNTSVAYSIGITGLSAATTYYYCAIAQNSAGTGFGSVVSFTTPAAPVVTTNAASSIGNTSAQLNGTGTPNGASTTGWFRYSLTNPGTCNDTFGSRAPTSGGTSLGSSYSPVAYSEFISGLSSGTTYYFCAIAQNSEGLAFGAVLTFTTATLPTVTTNAATAVTSSTATLNGSTNPNGASATGWFRYSTANPGTCTDSFGTRAPTSGGSSLGAGYTAVNYAQNIGSLLPGTTYYYCAISSNAYGTAFGAVLTFTTQPALPTVTTGSATLLTGTTATLNGTVNPGGAATTAWFRYATSSPGTCNDTFGTRAPASGGSSVGSGTSNQAYAQAITGLTAGTTYYYCSIAQNSVGTAFGNVLSFVTPIPPTVTTQAATIWTNTSVYLNGLGVPNGSATTGWFRYSTVSPGTCDDTFGSRAPVSGGTSLGSGYGSSNYSEFVTGLTAGTTYYYCAIVQSAEGTAFGAVVSFTMPTLPTVTTNAATAVASTTATLNGSTNPNGASSTGWFRYSTTNPGTCTDSFGTRAPTSGGSSLGAGYTSVNYAQNIGSLLPGTTYYFCAISNNSYGTAFGAVLTFTTNANAPTVTTGSVTALTGTGATLNATANPGGAATTGWFRYATSSPGTCNDTFGTRAPVSGGSSLGSGTSNQAFSQAITGLTAGTTYYYCAIAQNSVGTAFGSVLSFNTPVPPSVTTQAATIWTNTSVYLNGAAIPNGSATTGWFRYSTTDPGTCNDTFGSRAPTSGGTALGSGFASVNYSEFVTGLSAGTTYYYCAIASSVEGVAFGAVLNFTTPTSPTVTTQAATAVAATTATLNGTTDPNGASSTGWFRYSTTNPGTCSDSFGTRAPTSGGSSLGAGYNPVNYAQNIGSLLPGTTYYFCAISSNSYGTSFGTVLTFTTLAAAPTVTTGSATALTGTGATLNATGNPGGSATTGWFRYATSSPGTCNDTFGTRAPVSGGSSLGSGTSNQAFSQAITGLTAGTTYYYCAIAQNAVGTAFGNVLSFVSPIPPTATTQAATIWTNTSVYFNGAGVPNGSATTGWFRYSTVSPGTCDDTFGSRAPASGGTALGSGYSSVNYSEFVTGLSAGTTYYFCAIVQSAEGIAFGSVLSVTTPTLPTVTTNAATSVTATTATLNASTNPNGASSTGWFRYSTTNPGTCSDSFGTRAPTSGGSSLGAGYTAVNYAQNIGSLLPGTTYYFCAISNNTYGTAFGAVLSFTTTANAPTVTTGGVTLLTGTTATLNATSNPGGSATTGWFRYATTSPGTCNDTFGTRAPTSGGSSVGSGTSNTPFSQPVTGLTPGTTYYYCAIAQNAVGTAFGSVLSFVTPVPPTVTTNAVSSLANTSVQLNGSAIPNGSATTGWFRYALTDPGTCDDTFGSRAPVSGGTSLGSGTTSVAYAEFISGLSSGTTYYYCAIAQSSEGTAFGAVLSFTTAAAPTTTTTAATLVTATSATINGLGDPNGNSAFGYFRYSTASPGICNDLFGTRVPSSSSSDTPLGSGTTDVAFSRNLTGLTPGTTYYYCALARNTYGTTFGTVFSFTTLATTPTVTTNSATSVGTTTVTLNATANPNGAASTGWFRYGTASPGTCNDSFGTRAPAAGGSSLGAGTTNVNYSQGVTGLTQNTTYYFCAIAENSVGKSFGAVLTFTTTAPPTVATLAATPVTANTATLNGVANPNGFATTGWFRYSTTNPMTCDDLFGTRAPTSGGSALGSGTAAQTYAQAITGLLAGTTYYFCAIAQSSVGTSFGAVLSFTTPAAPPSVTTVAATLVTGNSATLNATVNPNAADTTAWFRYATTNPGSCNDSFGTRAPTVGGDNVGAGNMPVNTSQAITGLTGGTTYYYCAIASSMVGTSVGTVLTFTTANAPTVTTSAATAIGSTVATLNGSANPNLGDSTGWFRYATTSPGTCNDTFGTRAPAAGGTALGAGSAAVPFSQALTGLAPATTYYFCAIAENVVGKSFGSVLSFNTAAVPTVTTVAASAITQNAATLNGSANPNMLTATGWFRYSTTSPGTCNDTFGTRAPVSGGTALGAGSTAVNYSQNITGLAANTTYYYCAIASNSAGTGFGTVQSFTTAGAPVVTTVAASSVTTTGAQLNGSANPNQLNATGWFRYSATNPGTCNDTFGTRAPVSGGTALGNGTAAVAYSQSITGLVQGTTYYYCAIASNSAGTAFGTVMSFTTLSAPTVTTTAATTVASTSATLNGSANPKGDAATGWFRYATTNPGTCNDTFGTRAPVSGGTALGNGSAAVPYSEPITGLTPGTTYYFCAIAQNSLGTGFGTVLNFTTTAAPVVTTNAASAITTTGATLNGSGNPKLDAATGWFRYSTTNPGTCDDTFGTRAPVSGGTSLGSGNSAVAYSQAITGLTSGVTYYFCAIAQNSVGTSFGNVLSFTTLAAPVVTTNAATAVTNTSATLNGSANPNALASTGWFRYSLTNPGTCNDTFGTRAPVSGGTALGSGTAAVNYSQSITGLAASTTYYFCAIASNSAGTGFGTPQSFTTSGPPLVTTAAATAVTLSTATLNGSANPNQLSATGWFRYSATNPGTCNDTFGTRAPVSGGTALGSGTTSVDYSQPITGLVSGTTYYFCAIASNSAGTAFGTVLSFTTPATPIVTTVAASSVASSTATLNGTANPKGDATTGWFRYSTTNPGTCNDTFGTRAPVSGGTALGAGNTAAPYSEPLTGLAPTTTYYFCAIAQNSFGTAFGSVLSFTTLATPSVTTTAANGITATTATLNGSANPNGDATTGWFRYSTVDPGTCNDTFGTRAPAAGGVSLGSGATSVAYAQPISGLTAGTTYYFCAIASNSVGPGFGSVLSFTTAAPPTVTTVAASNIVATSATLNGSANPNLLASTGWFRYSATNPGTCNDTFGTRAPVERRHRPRRRLGCGLVLAGGQRPHQRHHVLLLRHRLQLGRHLVRHGDELHHHWRARRHHRGRVQHHRHLGRSQRQRQPQPRIGHRLVPLQHAPTRKLQRQLRHACPGRRRRSPRRRLHLGRLLAAGHQPHPRHHLLLLRHRAKRGRNSLRHRALVHNAVGAHRHHHRCHSGRQHRRHRQRHSQSQGPSHHGLVPLRHHQPRHLQRHIRHPRTGRRRYRSRLRQHRGALL